MDGASVNENTETWLPLAAAVAYRQHHVVVWLLSHGADPSAETVMTNGACESSPDILQLLIDAGGDVNKVIGGWSPLFWAIDYGRGDNVRVLLAQPLLHLTTAPGTENAQQFARDRNKHALSVLLAQVVRNGARVDLHRLHLRDLSALLTIMTMTLLSLSLPLP